MPWPMEVPKGRRIVSDVESNGLLAGMSGGGDHPPMDRIHCATAEDIDTGEHFEWTPETVHLYPKWLVEEVGVIIGHNFHGFDIRAIIQCWPEYKEALLRILILDTLIYCKMIWPADALIGPDMKRFNAGKMPGKYLKRQSLGAWGYRLGNYKGEYDGGWMEWSPDMQEYMVQDGKVNLDLWRLIERRIGWTGTGTTATSSGLPSPSSSQSFSPSVDTGAGFSPLQPLVPCIGPSTGPASTSTADGTYIWPWLPFWIEHEVSKVITAQEERGVAFNKDAAIKLIHDLKNKQAGLALKLEKVFGAWWEPLDNPEKGRRATRDRVSVCKQHPDIVTPRYGKKGQPLKPYVGPPKEHVFAGSVACRIRRTSFNPNSRDHLVDRLQKVFGWEPRKRTKSGKAQVDEKAIKSLPSSIIDAATRQVIMDYFVVTKTLGMVANGNKSWIHFVDANNRIHGRVDPLGTVTGRGAHYNPNLGQVMSVVVDEKKNAEGKIISKVPVMGLGGGYGYESRSLFTATEPDFPELTGTDMSSLEFILLGHDLYPLDDGEFSRRACDPEADLHEDHAGRAGMSRAHAKTLGYLIIYGGGALKAGMGMDVQEDEIADLLLDRGLPNRLRFMRKMLGPDYEEPSDLDKARIVKGARGIKSIKGAIPGLDELIGNIKEAAESRGYVLAIDGRKLFVRKPHAALNTRLQGNGAVACKLWIILFHRKMREAGYVVTRDFNQVLWVHDELQIEHRQGLGTVVKAISEEAAKEAGCLLNLRGTFRTESKTGRNWAETH